MIQTQAISAYKVLNEMSNIQMPVKTAYKLYQMRKSLEPIFEFRVEQERAILQKYNGKEAEGAIVFATTEDCEQAKLALNDLDAVEMEDEIVPIRMPIEDLDAAHLTMDDMAALEGFVLFE